jgi:hypothetical protein
MSLGVFGNKKLANVTKDDVDILYAFSPSNEVVGNLTLQPMYNNLSNSDFQKMFGGDGVYRMRLPASIFNKLGYYAILIKPKSFEVQITDCSFVVTNTPGQTSITQRGIVIPNIRINGGSSLVGYQIEYFDGSGNKIKNFFKIITSSDLVSVSTNTNTVNPGQKAYVLDPNGTSLFLTVTPDEGGTISSNQGTNIGIQGQTITISNTFFDPAFVEVEMVEHDMKTLSYGFYGNSTRDLETGIYTIFDANNSIYKQFNIGSIKKQTSNGIVEFKEGRENINLNQTYSDILNNS